MIRKFLMAAFVLVNVLGCGIATAQSHLGMLFEPSGYAGQRQVLEGKVVQVGATVVTDEGGLTSQVVGGSVGGAVCAGLARNAGWQAQAVAGVACGALGQMAGRTLATRQHAASEVLVRLSTGEVTVVVQPGDVGLQAGDSVFVIRNGDSSRVVKAM